MLWSDAFNVFSHRFLCKYNSFGHHNFMLYPLFQRFSACGHFRYGNQLLSDFYWKSFAAVATWALLAKWQRRPLESICCHIDLSTIHSDIVLQYVAASNQAVSHRISVFLQAPLYISLRDKPSREYIHKAMGHSVLSFCQAGLPIPTSPVSTSELQTEVTPSFCALN